MRSAALDALGAHRSARILACGSRPSLAALIYWCRQDACEPPAGMRALQLQLGSCQELWGTSRFGRLLKGVGKLD